MTEPQQSQTDLSVWHVPGRTPLILYSREVCERIVADAFESLRRSGGQDETGGMLFGSADDDEVKITASRAFHRESGGPLLFSEDDHARMQQMIQSTASEPELRKLVPVGCYRARIEGDLALSDGDTEIWNRHFPFRWQVVLLLRVEEGKPVRAGFFFRPPKGVARLDAPLKEFELEAPPLPKPAAVEENLPVYLPRELFRIPAERGPGRAKWYAMGAIAALGAMGAGYQYGRLFTESSVAGPAFVDAGLRLSERDGFLTAEWSRESPGLKSLRDARLSIADGTRETNMSLADPLLASATWSVVRATEDVRVRIVGTNAANEPVVLQSARFVGPLTKPESPREDGAAEAPANEQRAEVERLQTLLDRATRTNRTREERLANVARLIQIRATAQNRTLASDATRPPETAAVKPAPPLAPVSPVASNSAPAALAPAVTVQLPAPEPERYSGPASGRIIWTGHLPPNSSLTIDDRRASAGTVSGALPPVTARVSVYAAEITSAGLSLFTANSSRANATEARSARTGWMNTTFVYDTARAQDARLAEAPSSASPRKIVIRSGDRALSAAVIDWQVAR